MSTATYRTIKELVIHLYETNNFNDADKVAAEVKNRFPNSKWQKTHYNWYRSKILKGHIKTRNLTFSKRELLVKDKREPLVKKIGDNILKHIDFIFEITAKNDDDFRFKLNRWVFSRLQQKEKKIKERIKRQLWKNGIRSCQAPGCQKNFESLKNVEIHRPDRNRIYSDENCMLVCHDCHRRMG